MYVHLPQKSNVLYLFCQGFVGPQLRVSLGLLIHTVSVFPSEQHLKKTPRGKGESDLSKGHYLVFQCLRVRLWWCYTSRYFQFLLHSAFVKYFWQMHPNEHRSFTQTQAQLLSTRREEARRRGFTRGNNAVINILIWILRFFSFMWQSCGCIPVSRHSLWKLFALASPSPPTTSRGSVHRICWQNARASLEEQCWKRNVTVNQSVCLLYADAC